MKTVLAELHELINDLEDQGLTAEASSLQEVFVRVAQEADMDEMAEPTETDDLANDVAGLLKSHSAAEVLTEIAKQMGGAEEAPMSDTETMSFAFGDEPSADDAKANRMKMYKDITEDYASKANRKDGTAEDLFKQMNEELSGNGFPTMFMGTFNGLRQQLASPDYFAKMNAELGGPNNLPSGRRSPNN